MSLNQSNSLNTKYNLSPPKYGVPFRMDDYQNRVVVQPVKTQRRQQQDNIDNMGVLIQRRLPADKLSGIHNQTEFSQIKPPDKNKHKQVMTSNDEIKENTNTNTNIGTSNQWKCVKYACCCMCGCTVCTTAIGLMIALCYEL